MVAVEPWNCSGSSLVEEATAMLGGSPAAAAEGGEGKKGNPRGEALAL